MAHRKEKSNLGGDPVSAGKGIILKGSVKEATGKREASQLPDPEVKPGAKSGAPKKPKLEEKSINKGGSSTATEELHLVDESDGIRWTIQDKTVIDLLRRYKSASDQKTKDEIVKLLESYVASLMSKNSKISQASKKSSKKCSSHQPPMQNAEYLSKIIEKVQSLKLHEIPQVFMPSTKIQASQSDKQFQDPKNGGTKDDLDGNGMDVDNNTIHQPSMPSSVRLPREGK